MSTTKLRLKEKRLKKAVAVDPGDITTANGSDAGTTQTLANANKAKLNTLMANLRAAGILG